MHHVKLNNVIYIDFERYQKKIFNVANRIDINSKTEFLNRATMMDFVELYETFVSIAKSYNRSREKREGTGGKEDNIKVDGRRKEIFLLASHTEERAEAFGY